MSFFFFSGVRLRLCVRTIMFVSICHGRISIFAIGRLHRKGERERQAALEIESGINVIKPTPQEQYKRGKLNHVVLHGLNHNGGIIVILSPLSFPYTPSHIFHRPIS